MKRKIALFLILAALLPAFAACGAENTPNETEQQEIAQAADSVGNPETVSLGENGTANYTVIRSDMVGNDDPETKAALVIKRALEEKLGTSVKISTDWIENGGTVDSYANVPEILIGQTNRPETAEAIEGLKSGEYVIAVSENGMKIVICGVDKQTTERAAAGFAEMYITGEGATLELTAGTRIVAEADYSLSGVHAKKYTEMGDDVLAAFTGEFYQRGILKNTEFWDAMEILEAYIDAYEQTGSEKYLEYVKNIAKVKGAKEDTSFQSNDYNDDIAWACIAYTRIHLLTGEEVYLTVAKNNFDAMYKRALSDDLGGGLFWRTDNQTKNSCINCPASIAACLIGKATGDDSYFEKAQGLMEWEFKNMFDAGSGAVWDAYNLSGDKNKWASTYNQGTFIGACTLLHEKYGTEKYLEYAAKAANYAMNNLELKNGVLNGENSGGDLIGFKGILTRWLYRFAKYTDDREILLWLQNNADTAYSNRNKDNFIWTTWAEKTPNDIGGMDIFGFSTAIALMFNSVPW